MNDEYRELSEFPGYRINRSGSVQSWSRKSGWRVKKTDDQCVRFMTSSGRKSQGLFCLIVSVFPDFTKLEYYTLFPRTPRKKQTPNFQRDTPNHPEIFGVHFCGLVDYPGYLFGDDGSLWSCRQSGGSISSTWKQLKPPGRDDGRIITSIRNASGKLKGVLLSRLILEAFAGPCPKGMECCHYDGNPGNSEVSNLRWDTRKGNHADKIRHGTGNKGSRHNLAKLTEEQVLEIRKKYDSERNGPRLGRIFTLQALADEYGVTRGMTHRIVNRLNWTHV